MTATPTLTRDGKVHAASAGPSGPTTRCGLTETTYPAGSAPIDCPACLTPPVTEEERMQAARARALWEIGDASWAGVIIGAYLHPREDAAALAAEKGEPS